MSTASGATGPTLHSIFREDAGVGFEDCVSHAAHENGLHTMRPARMERCYDWNKGSVGAKRRPHNAEPSKQCYGENKKYAKGPGNFRGAAGTTYSAGDCGTELG